jgi:acetyl-CoA C-acetyltransferase
MSEAFIYDAVRTPRGSGRSCGGFAHAVAGRCRRRRADRLAPTHRVRPHPPWIFGCGDGVNDLGANVARSAVLHSGMDVSIT